VLIFAASLAALVAGSTITEFPGGTIEIPPACTAPAQIKWTHDVFLGSIKCPKDGLTILLWGDPYTTDPCKTSPDILGLPSRSEFYRIPLSSGDSITVCTSEHKAAETGRLIKEMIIDLGPAPLIAEIQTPRQAYLLLQIAMSYRSVKAVERK
jgi:hypothetical protein